MKLVKSSVFLAAVVVSAAGLLFVMALGSGLAADHGRGREGGRAGGNGDVNCDGKIGIDDVVQMLGHLFKGGEEPCALADERGMNGLIEKVDQLAKVVWPPKPRDIVNLYVAIPRDEDDAVFTVPEKKWFIVTDVVTNPMDPYYCLSIIEKQGHEETTKAEILQAEPTKQAQVHYTVGLKFAPESTLHLKSSPTTDVPRVQITGHLADD